MANKNTDDIDILLDELKDTKKFGAMIPIEAPAPTVQPELTDDNINSWIMNKAGLVIQQGVDTLERIKDSVRNSAEAEEVDSYSKLLNAVSSAVDTLNKINIQNKRNKSAKELKKMDIDMKNGQIEGKNNVTNNIIIATREEMMQKLFGEAEEEAKTIDVTSTEINDSQEEVVKEIIDTFDDAEDIPEELKSKLRV